ncbi:hypothetical protein [Cohnella sp.]|uniref:hypothetical protein n=1 Tax=Cohnella sp. TaxID=1883426 RepID=UPI0035672B03
MITEKLYAEVSRIVGSIQPLTGAYLKTRVEGVERGDIKLAQLKLDLRIAAGKFDQAHAELNAIRFPRFRQRFEFAKFTAGIQHYNRAIPLIIEAVETGSATLWRKVDGKLAAAARANDNYISFVYRDRTEGRRS